MSGRFQVAKWEEFQHYKKRRPPWIRLYRRILDDRRYCEVLTLADCGLLTRCWVLASEEMDGSFTADEGELRFRLRIPSFTLSMLKPLVDNGFIVDASNVLATCEHLAPKSCSETETETETETDTRESLQPASKKLARSRDYEEDAHGYAVNSDLVDAAYGHYLRLWNKDATAYRLTPQREDIVRKALRIWGLERVLEAILIFHQHPAYAFQRGEDPRSNGRKFDGLAEYILSYRGHASKIESRIEEILGHGEGPAGA